jgi:hypothetical protein
VLADLHGGNLSQSQTISAMFLKAELGRESTVSICEPGQVGCSTPPLRPTQLHLHQPQTTMIFSHPTTVSYE